MRYYASKCHDTLNGKSFNVEKITPFLCLNPYYKVNLTEPATYLLDSGAFQDVRASNRLTFQKALDRQLAFEKDVGHMSASIVSYDRLVDEKKDEGGAQFKERVGSETGAEYVEETIKAAEFLASKRDTLSPRELVLSCQGVTVNQYLGCISNVLDLAIPGDVIGIGGFCILSRSKEYEREFYEILTEAIPMIASRGINRVHIFGMSVFRVLIQVELYARMYGVSLSYDTSSAEMNSVFGKVFSPIDGQLKTVFGKQSKYIGYHPADLTFMNIRTINSFWNEIDTLPTPKEGYRPGME